VYFEAFDQPWKDTQPIEPHWGLFYNDRLPKPAAASVCR
ncbi:MAG: glycosyl hydrolase, partial [Chloroflexi bacterium]|nr:glycosyl hydrolase [Chloroflexota bacterium]